MKVRNSLPRVAFLILFLLVLAIGIILRTNNLNNVVGRSADEVIYTNQARVILLQGMNGIKALVQEYRMNKELWIYPPPTRVGYLWLLAGVMKITNNVGPKAGAYISYIFSIISMLLLIAIGRRFFNLWITLYALLFMSVSPPDLAIARRTWQDAMLGCLGLALVYFSCEITRNSRKQIWYALLTVAGSYCLFIKELGVVIYGLCLLWVLCLLFIKEKTFAQGFLFIGISSLCIGFCVFLLAQAVGGIRVIADTFVHLKDATLTNAYGIEYQSYPWYYFLQGFWLLSPLNAVFFSCGIISMLQPLDKTGGKSLFLNNENRNAVFGIIFFTIAYLTIILMIPNCQNFRYVSVLYAPFYLISGLGFWQVLLLRKMRTKYFFSIPLTVLVIISAVYDYQNFKKIFLRTGNADVSLRMIREASRR